MKGNIGGVNMNFWDYLRKQATKALVSKLGELHRQEGRKTNEEDIDLNDPHTQWALSCEAVGSDYWEE